MFAYGFILMSFVTLLTLWSKWHLLWQVSLLEDTNYYLRGSKEWLFKPLLNWCHLLHCQEEHVLLSEPPGTLVRKQGPTFPGVKEEQSKSISAMRWRLCAEGEPWSAVSLWFFLPPPFRYLLLSLSPSFWMTGTFGVWQHTTLCMGQTKVPCSVLESSFVASRKRKRTRSPGIFKL